MGKLWLWWVRPLALHSVLNESDKLVTFLYQNSIFFEMKCWRKLRFYQVIWFDNFAIGKQLTVETWIEHALVTHGRRVYNLSFKTRQHFRMRNDEWALLPAMQSLLKQKSSVNDSIRWNQHLSFLECQIQPNFFQFREIIANYSINSNSEWDINFWSTHWHEFLLFLSSFKTQ